MNAKKCKEIRQKLRRAGIDVKEIKLVHKASQFYEYFTGDRKLYISCGRYAYRSMKRNARLV